MYAIVVKMFTISPYFWTPESPYFQLYGVGSPEFLLRTFNSPSCAVDCMFICTQTITVELSTFDLPVDIYHAVYLGLV